MKKRAFFAAMAGLASHAMAATANAEQPVPAREKMGMRVTTPTGMGLLAGFSVTGPSDDIQAVSKRLIAAGCPPPMVTPLGNESSLFGPFSDHCDKGPTLALLSEIQTNKYPKLHSLDVQFFPLPTKAN